MTDQEKYNKCSELLERFMKLGRRPTRIPRAFDMKAFKATERLLSAKKDISDAEIDLVEGCLCKAEKAYANEIGFKPSKENEGKINRALSIYESYGQHESI